MFSSLERNWGWCNTDSLQSFIVCVCVCVVVRKWKGVGVGENAGCVMLLLWQIDVKSSGASLFLHKVNNDERSIDEGLLVDVWMRACLCLMVLSNAPCIRMSVHDIRECQDLTGGMVDPDQTLGSSFFTICTLHLPLIYLQVTWSIPKCQRPINPFTHSSAFLFIKRSKRKMHKNFCNRNFISQYWYMSTFLVKKNN